MQVRDFSEPLKQLLNAYAEKDEELKKAMAKPNKSFEGCVNYIKDLVQKQNKDNKFSMYCRDEELVGECFHYYQEDSLDFEPKKETPKVTKTTAPTAKTEDVFGDCDWGEDAEEQEEEQEETLTPTPKVKVELKTVKAPEKKKPTSNEDNSDDIFGDCDW